MSDALSRDVLGWAEIGRQHIELLPARTVLTTSGGGDGGDVYVNAYSGDAYGGDAFAYAEASHNYNSAYDGDAYQSNYADADAYGGDAYSGDVYVDAYGGNGGDSH